MSKVIDFFARRTRQASRAPLSEAARIADMIRGFSIEVMPRTAARVESFAEILPRGTRVYVAHIDGTPIEDMVETARRITAEGFEAMPHFPARSIPSKAALADWIARYRDEAGVRSALLLGGGVAQPRGAFHCSMQLMETGLFDAAGFTRLHVAGHPEGNRDIDADGSEANVMAALKWKQAFSERTDATMAIATQFVFEAGPVVAWAGRLREAGVDLPIHVGVAGPAKLQTLIKYALTCGVGPSVQVLQKRAADVTKLMLPFTPDRVLADIAAARAADPALQIEQVHFFPLGGIGKTAEYTTEAGASGRSAAYA
ncbi:5,10-methylenetetrahydrofolate reductase [Albimonas pacifica]|uniref:Methylenetetrahydrofolate reductase (NADPH) n=1 Tax=Albimonas pacifica TaxID=1114924 RepID=A0A1I3I0M1_9RHOB|nr:methylenetetrahydrofolate reductase (NADPH) [Albimonas pacifica]